MSGGRKVAMGISPTEVAEIPVEEPEVIRDDVAGRSPTQIALSRLRSDKIALVCSVIVLIFVLIAIFAPLAVTRYRKVSAR